METETQIFDKNKSAKFMELSKMSNSEIKNRYFTNKTTYDENNNFKRAFEKVLFKRYEDDRNVYLYLAAIGPEGRNTIYTYLVDNVVSFGNVNIENICYDLNLIFKENKTAIYEAQRFGKTKFVEDLCKEFFTNFILANTLQANNNNTL